MLYHDVPFPSPRKHALQHGRTTHRPVSAGFAYAYTHDFRNRLASSACICLPLLLEPVRQGLELSVVLFQKPLHGITSLVLQQPTNVLWVLAAVPAVDIFVVHDLFERFVENEAIHDNVAPVRIQQVDRREGALHCPHILLSVGDIVEGVFYAPADSRCRP